MPEPEFTTSVERLLAQVGHWQAGRWSTRPASAPPSAPSRSDTVYALVQRLADLAADAENRPRRRVPRLSALVLPDQVRVVADDLLALSVQLFPRGAQGKDVGPVLRQATEEIDNVRRAL